MKKNSTKTQSAKRATVGKEGRMTIGMDLGDKVSRYYMLDQNGGAREEGSVGTTRQALTRKYAGLRRSRIAIEVGTHSPWISRLLKHLGHEVIVANARQVRLISASSRKNDRMDAQVLARLARIDSELLRPIQHRSEQAQQHLAMIRVRAALVEARTKLLNAARGFSKAQGERLPAGDAATMGVEQMTELPAGLQEVLRPLLEQVESLSGHIQGSDKQLEQIARTHYPETQLLRQVSGVGPLIALTFVLTLDNRERFQKSRDAGCYVGLRPRQQDSGASQPQLPITKEGDRYLRTLLVQGAHHILGWRGPDTDLRRWGLKLASRGGKNGKKRAVVAVARKLAVLLHRLWVTGEVYEPLRNSQGAAPSQKAA
jgi:transposase